MVQRPGLPGLEVYVYNLMCKDHGSQMDGPLWLGDQVGRNGGDFAECWVGLPETVSRNVSIVDLKGFLFVHIFCSTFRAVLMHGHAGQLFRSPPA